MIDKSREREGRILPLYRRSFPQVFYKSAVLKAFAKFTVKNLC